MVERLGRRKVFLYCFMQANQKIKDEKDRHGKQEHDDSTGLDGELATGSLNFVGGCSRGSS